MSLERIFHWKEEKELFKNNRAQIDSFLISVTCVSAIILGILMAVMVVVAFKLGYTDTYKKVYSAIFVFDALLLASTRICRNFFHKRPVVFVYAFFVIYLCFAIMANYSNNRQQEYVSLVCAIFMIPLLILDRSYRVGILVFLAFATSVLLSYNFKTAEFFRADVVNLLVYTVAGVVVGKNVRFNRLKGFDEERVLALERNTDSLTKLANRRNLFDHLRRGVDDEARRPSGMFMMDIDHFKQYNDSFGHRAGDICLGAIGHCFSDFGEAHGMKFFRYGGEEFCALCWTKDYGALGQAAQELLESVRSLQLPFEVPENPSGIVTISLGYAAFDRSAPYDFEEMIKTADGALYAAKENGRNQARGA